MAPDRYSLEHIFVLPSFLLFAFPATLSKKKANISNEETALNNPTVFLFYLFFFFVNASLVHISGRWLLDTCYVVLGALRA